MSGTPPTSWRKRCGHLPCRFGLCTATVDSERDENDERAAIGVGEPLRIDAETERMFMERNVTCRVYSGRVATTRNIKMRNFMVGVAAAAVAAFASPSYADGFPPYRDQGTTYQRESHTYEREYRPVEPRVRVAPRVVETPVLEETVVVRRPVVVTRPSVVVEEYSVYETPVYVRPRIYAYAGPRWRHHFWGGRRGW